MCKSPNEQKPIETVHSLTLPSQDARRDWAEGRSRRWPAPAAHAHTALPARSRLRTSHHLQAFGLLTPYLLGSLLLVVLPAIAALGMAFTRYDALASPTFVGLENFRAIIGDRFFWIALGNSLQFVALAVPLRLAGALFLALLLNRKGRTVGVVRTVVYVPTIIPSAAYSLMWLLIFNPIYGPINAWLAAMGLPTPAWLLQPATARLVIVFISCWQIGEGFVILLASRQDIPNDLYAAAVLDGANRWQSFWSLTLPLLWPKMLLLIFRDTVASFQGNFVPAFIMTRGGPNWATTYLPLYIYDTAFDNFQFGYAASLVWVVLLLTAAMFLLQHVASRRWVGRYDF
jgi:multiple sugar transport system permease protein